MRRLSGVVVRPLNLPDRGSLAGFPAASLQVKAVPPQSWVIDPEGNKVELWQPPAGQRTFSTPSTRSARPPSNSRWRGP
jgi:hypothetical protein